VTDRDIPDVVFVEIVFQLLDRHFIPLDGPTNLLLGIIGENPAIKGGLIANVAGDEE
jgi:hypothetical protein